MGASSAQQDRLIPRREIGGLHYPDTKARDGLCRAPVTLTYVRLCEDHLERTRL